SGCNPGRCRFPQTRLECPARSPFRTSCTAGARLVAAPNDDRLRVGTRRQPQGDSMASRHLFTSESVTEGHPDKIADQISDAVLDALIAQDRTSRVACETLVTTGLAVVAGEITSHGYVEIPALVRKVIGEIGYDSADYGFDCHTCAVVTTIDD